MILIVNICVFLGSLLYRYLDKQSETAKAAKVAQAGTKTTDIKFNNQQAEGLLPLGVSPAAYHKVEGFLQQAQAPGHPRGQQRNRQAQRPPGNRRSTNNHAQSSSQHDTDHFRVLEKVLQYNNHRVRRPHVPSPSNPSQPIPYLNGLDAYLKSNHENKVAPQSLPDLNDLDAFNRDNQVTSHWQSLPDLNDVYSKSNRDTPQPLPDINGLKDYLKSKRDNKVPPRTPSQSTLKSETPKAPEISPSNPQGSFKPRPTFPLSPHLVFIRETESTRTLREDLQNFEQIHSSPFEAQYYDFNAFRRDEQEKRRNASPRAGS